VFAKELTLSYSDWSTYYPSNIPEVFVQRETRYHFYKVVNGQVVYDDGYYTELDGYTKDEQSAREFYRYITNDYLLFNGYNELVLDDVYCVKSFCYMINRGNPTMVSTDEKFDPEYTNNDIPNVTGETVPFTGDQVIYYFIGFFLSIITVVSILIIKRRKQIIRA
jgi:hypothetical protein